MLDRAHLFLAAILLTTAAAACTKTEGPSGTTSSSTAMGSIMAAPSASAMMAAPDASPMAADTTTGSAPTGGADATAPAMSATAATSGKPATSGSAAADSAPACGTKPLPDCPLQAWMKANTNPAIASGDLPGLATALDKAAGFAPAGYSNWATIAKDGAKAAKGGDMTAAKASCRTCHDQYKEKYKKEMRARKI